jgi:outer membrane biosynthesis protein TonB
MNAGTRQNHASDILDPSMKGPLIASSVFHFALFVITAVGLPFISTSEKIISTPISVELVEIDKITQTNKPPAPKPVEEEPIKEEPPPMAKPEPPPLKEAAPPELEKPKPPEKPVEKPKAEEKPKEKPKPKEEPKKEEKKDNKDFQNLLKNLTPAEPDRKLQDVLETAENSNPSQSSEAPLGERLTMSEEDAMRHQITPCWNVPAGAKFAEDLAVEIRVFMNRDGTIRDSVILDQGRYNRDAPFRAAADSARRALQNPRCQPLKYPPEKYEQLKVFIFRFDPSEML